MIENISAVMQEPVDVNQPDVIESNSTYKRTNDLKTDSQLDKAFKKIKKEIDQTPTPDDFSMIYDFARRFQNLYGFCPVYIEKLYLLGYINGKKEGNIKTVTSNSDDLRERWEDYAEKYNTLGDEMEKANIDIKLLIDLNQATIALYCR